MTWTILFLVVAVLLYVFAGKLVKVDEKKSSSAMHIAKKCVKLGSIVLLVVGIERLGIGNSYYSANKFLLTLQESQQYAQQKKTEMASRMAKEYVAEHGEEMAKWAPVAGNEKGSKTIYVWTATACPYCRRVHNELNRVINDDKDVRVVIKNFPVHGMIEDIPSRWIIAAKLQSNAKAIALYEKIMTEQYWGEDTQDKNMQKNVTKNVEKYAKSVGLDVDKLKKAINGPEVAQEMQQVRQLAGEFGIQGTPYLIVNGKVFPGYIPYAQIMDALK